MKGFPEGAYTKAPREILKIPLEPFCRVPEKQETL